MKLIIIGNGFDLHHGMKTKYSDFKNSLPDKDIRKIENIFSISNGNWSNLENNIAKSFDNVHGIIQNVLENVYVDVDYDEPWKQDDEFGYVFEEDVRNELIWKETINSHIYHWIKSLDTPNKKTKIYDLLKNSKIVDFNYTKTSEVVYGISKDKILYIHGNKDDESKIQFGSIKKIRPDKATGFWSDYGNNWDYSKFFEEYEKNTPSNLLNLEKFLSDSYDEIIVFGHSFGIQDFDYFQKIFSLNKKNIKIKSYNKEDKTNQIREIYGVDSTFVKTTDL